MFIPADLEPAKIDHALAYGATVVPIDGTYDDVNRLCLEVADETGWGFVNINLRPFYAEGSKTLAFEIAESLGWRSPDVIVAPIASGAMFTSIARGFEQLVALGLIGAGRSASSAARRPAAARSRRRARAATSSSRSARPTRSSARWRSATRPTGITRSSWRARRGGSIEAIDDATTAEAIRDVARLEGMYTETAGGVTLGARRRGPPARRHPDRRRGRGPPDRQRAQDARGRCSASPTAPRRPAGASGPRARLPPAFGVRAWLDGSA